MLSDKCEKCLHSRPIISENGWHSICCLSGKASLKCLTGEKDRFAENPMRKDSAE